MNNRQNEIPNNLKECRREAGLTQQALAEKLGFISNERISHWEKGKNVPSLLNLLKLALIYKKSVEELYPELKNKVRKEFQNNK